MTEPLTPTRVQMRDELRADARNRAFRTFLQGLGVDVAVAVAVVLVTVFSDADGWGDLQWAVIGFSLAKSVVTSVASYVMRAFLDKSRLPTPLPPEPVVAPAAPVDTEAVTGSDTAGQGITPTL